MIGWHQLKSFILFQSPARHSFISTKYERPPFHMLDIHNSPVLTLSFWYYDIFEKRQIKVCSKGGDIYVRIANTQEKIQIQGVLKRRGDMCGSRASQRAGMQSLVPSRTSLLNRTSSVLRHKSHRLLST